MKKLIILFSTIKSIEESDLLIKRVSETIKNEAKEQKGKFLCILLGTLGASLLENLLTGKDTIKADESTIRAVEGLIRTGQDFQHFLILRRIFKYKSIIKMNLNLIVFIQEIIYLK